MKTALDVIEKLIRLNNDYNKGIITEHIYNWTMETIFSTAKREFTKFELRRLDKMTDVHLLGILKISVMDRDALDVLDRQDVELKIESVKLELES